MIAQRLGMLTTSVDGVADGQQDMLSRDYSTELAKIHDITQRMREAIITLSNKPALLQTPNDIANQITVAGRNSRKEDHAALVTARQDMQQAASTLATMTASARTARQQNQWLACAAGLALVLGSIGGCTIPPAMLASALVV